MTTFIEEFGPLNVFREPRQGSRKEIIYDDQDGLPIRENSKWSCHYCIPELVYLGYGDYAEIVECCCQDGPEPSKEGWGTEK